MISSNSNQSDLDKRLIDRHVWTKIAHALTKEERREVLDIWADNDESTIYAFAVWYIKQRTKQ